MSPRPRPRSAPRGSHPARTGCHPSSSALSPQLPAQSPQLRHACHPSSTGGIGLRTAARGRRFGTGAQPGRAPREPVGRRFRTETTGLALAGRDCRRSAPRRASTLTEDPNSAQNPEFPALSPQLGPYHPSSIRITPARALSPQLPSGPVRRRRSFRSGPSRSRRSSESPTPSRRAGFPTTPRDPRGCRAAPPGHREWKGAVRPP